MPLVWLKLKFNFKCLCCRWSGWFSSCAPCRQRATPSQRLPRYNPTRSAIKHTVHTNDDDDDDAQVGKRQLDTYGSPAADPQIDSYGPPNAPICQLQVIIIIMVTMMMMMMMIIMILETHLTFVPNYKIYIFHKSVSQPFCDGNGCNESNYPNNTDRLVNVFVAARVPGIS